MQEGYNLGGHQAMWPPHKLPFEPNWTSLGAQENSQPSGIALLHISEIKGSGSTKNAVREAT